MPISIRRRMVVKGVALLAFLVNIFGIIQTVESETSKEGKNDLECVYAGI